MLCLENIQTHWDSKQTSLQYNDECCILGYFQIVHFLLACSLSIVQLIQHVSHSAKGNKQMSTACREMIIPVLFN